MAASDVNIRKYWALLLKRRKLFLLVALVVISVGILLGLRTPPRYEASSTVFIERSVINDLVRGIAVTQSIENRLRVLAHALSSRNLLLGVIHDLELDLKYEQPEEIQALVEKFRRNTEVRVTERDLFIIRYVDTDPELAMRYVNALVQRYISDNIYANRQDSYGANRFIQEQVAFFKQKIEEAEAKLTKFRQEADFSVVQDEAVIFNEIRTLQAALEDMQIRGNELAARKALLQRGSVGGAAAGDDAGLAALKRRREQLLLFYTENYPEVRLVDAEIERAREQLKAGGGENLFVTSEERALEIGMLEIELAGLTEKQRQMQRTLEERRSLQAMIPEKVKQLRELERERNTFTNTYEQLVTRYGSSEVSKQMEIQDKADTFRVVDPAILPKVPIGPNRVQMILLSLAAGISAGFGLLLAIDYFDTRVKDLDSVQDLGVPVLAVIPQFTTREERLRQRKANLALTALVSVYLLGVLLLLVLETIGLVPRV